MTKTVEFKKQTMTLIDDLKSVCANYGLGNDGNEFKIITQIFLYKFLNDKFVYEIKKIDKNIEESENWEETLKSYSDDEYEMLLMQLSESTAHIKPNHYISSLYAKQNEPNFADIFDDTLTDIAAENIDIFSVKTIGGEKVLLFERLSRYVTDDRDNFCRAIINKLITFSFEHIFNEKFDFYATIFEYLIKDYNSNSGGKYAEYFTPHAVASIMSRCLVEEEISNVTCYDPSAGSGSLLMSLAHQIGEGRCSIYSQDISQKSSHLLRLNLILNDLVHSIPNVIKGNTLVEPYHKSKSGKLQEFDYVVSNPPFKLDFSEFREYLDSKENHDRFFAGVPKIPIKKKGSMSIYLMFVQHIMHVMNKQTGKAAIVVPTGFITAQSGIEKRIRTKLVDNKMLKGVISMPSNIFAETGTNVSVLFLDYEINEEVILIDASSLGSQIKEGKNKKTVLNSDEEEKIITTFIRKEKVDDFSVIVSYKDVKEKNYSLSAGQYFEVKIEYEEITHKEFEAKLKEIEQNLTTMFDDSKELSASILKNLHGLKYDI